MEYMHTGVPLPEKIEGMMFVEPLKVWVTDAATHPYAVEFLYFEPESKMAASIQNDVHVAYKVDDIQAAIAGKAVLWDPTDLGDLIIAFVYDNDMVVELAQIK